MLKKYMPGGIDENLGELLLNAILKCDAVKIKRLGARHPVDVALFFGDAESLSAQYVSRSLEELPIHGLEAEFKRWRAMAEAAMDLGWMPGAQTRGRWRHRALSSPLPPWLIEWLVDKGVWSEGRDESFAGSGAQGLVQSFAGQSEDDLRILAKLVSVKILRDGDGEFGLMDFLCASHIERGVGQIKSAKLLASLGFKPRGLASHWLGFDGEGGSLPACALMQSLTPRAWPAGESPADVVARAVEALDWLGTLGVNAGGAALGGVSVKTEPVEHDGFGWDMPWVLVDPLAALARGRAHYETRPKREIFEAMALDLVARGVDPNATGGFLFELCSLAGRDDTGKWSPKGGPDGWERVKFAIGLGADPKRWPGHALSAALPSWNVVEKLLALGADPSQAPMLSSQLENPMARAFLDANAELGWRFVEMGASPAWTDKATGRTLLHRFAGEANKKGLDVLRRLLERPDMKALVNVGCLDSASQGQAPLHVACGAMSMEAVKFLLAAGADVNQRDARGWTPLRHLLRSYGVKAKKKVAPLADLLLGAGADPSIPDLDGRTPAQAAAKRAPVEALAELLRLRPEDVLGEGAASKKAKEALAKREGAGRSLLEKVEISAATEPSAGADGSKPAKKVRRSL